MALPGILDLSIQCGWYIIFVFIYFWNCSINIFVFPSLKKKNYIRQLATASSKKFFSISVSGLQYAKSI